VRLTPAGEAFLADARRVLAVVDAAPEAARRVAAGEVGTLRLSFTVVGAYAVLDDVLDLVHGSLPGATVALTEMISADQFDALSALQVDLALARPPMVLAVPADHQLARGSRPLRLAEITRSPVDYRYDGEKNLYEVCAVMIDMDTFLTTQRVSQVPTMLALVRARRGFALVPQSAMAMSVAGVAYRQLSKVDAPVVSLHACWNPDSTNPVLRRIVDRLLDRF
jgi:DNA-binding transcriptional LysR family regulator